MTMLVKPMQSTDQKKCNKSNHAVPVDAEIRHLLFVEMCTVFTDGSVGVMGSALGIDVE